MAILTPTELRSRINLLANEPDSTLTDLIDEFTDIVEDYRGTSYTQRTTTEAIYLPATRDTLWLDHRDIQAISSIQIDGTALTSDDYTLDRADGVIRDCLFLAGSTVTITYTYGAGTRTVTDGVTTSGSTTISSATALFDGDDIAAPVSGTGIPADTTIVSVTASTAVLSAAATASGTGVTFTINEAPKAVQRACAEYVRASVLADRSGVPRDVIGQSFEGTYTRYSTPDKAAGRPTGYLDIDRLLNMLEDRRRMHIC